MPEKAAEDESWSQTLITITPEEDASIRTITGTTVISGVSDSPLTLGVNQISDRRTLQFDTMRRDLFIDNAELEEEGMTRSDTGCQTFLRGVPNVELPSAFREEATQTMYMGCSSISAPSVLRPFHDIARIMNERIMPTAAGRITEVTQTVVTFEPGESRSEIVDRLTSGITAEDIRGNDYSTEPAITASTCARDNLHFVLDRVLWLSDPGHCLPEVKLKDEVAQTFIKFDHGLGKVVLDADTQTSLTCEPSRSNAGLLSEWSATKEFAHDVIDECIERAVDPRLVAHSMIDEVVERCASQIHLPYRDEIVQTLALCDALKDKDDEVLRKLRLGVVLDTLESSIIVLPLAGILVERTCAEVRENARNVAAEIVNRIQKKSVTMATRLAAIRQEAASHKTMEDIFDARRKRLRELLRDKRAAKISSTTQTGLAGVPDIMKVKEPRETICLSCACGQSECDVCETSLQGNEQVNPTNGRRDAIVIGNILRTQDILIARNPDYVVTTTSKILKIQPHTALPRRLPAMADLPASGSSSTSWEPETERPLLRDDVCPPASGPRSAKLKVGGSLNDWARVAQGTLSISGAWSIRGSSSADSNTILRQVGASSRCTSLSRKPPNRECARSRCSMSVRSVNALRILKKTFNREEGSCSDCSYDNEKVDVKLSGKGGAVGTGRTSSRDNKREELGENQHTSRGSGFDQNSYDEGVRVVPIIHLSDQINKK